MGEVGRVEDEGDMEVGRGGKTRCKGDMGDGKCWERGGRRYPDGRPSNEDLR